METMLLNGEWKLTGSRQGSCADEKVTLSATVPGCVQLDLSKVGYLPGDLYMGENIRQTERYEDWQWWYERTFQCPKTREHVFLVFEGVDCIAHYYLNGQKIGDTENMFIAYEFEIGKYLVDGENVLTVHIESPVIAAHRLDYDAGNFMNWCNPATATAIRKAPHSYGWDIMPRAVTSGIWRDVKLEMRDPIRFSQLFFAPSAQGCRMLYQLECAWDALQNVELEVVGSCADSCFRAKQSLSSGKVGYIDLEIPDPILWWPYGYGEANLYNTTVRVYSAGQLVHETTGRFGLRTVELERSDITDGKNGYFRFLVNGEEILCKGSNWVPLDAFHCRDARRYAEALALVKDIGCNILRCWGGNVYEDHAFYDFCDENGILIWQDFSMACAFYPQDARFEALMRQEATAVIRKLRNHPSIALWAGDNEVDVMALEFQKDPAQNRITRQVLPEVVRLNDPTRPYLPSSPYVTEAVYKTGSVRTCPEDHLWGPRDYYKSSFYKENPAHFVSETGYHGCPALESIQKFITPDKVWPYQNNSQWILHSSDQKENDSRVMLMEKQVRQLFGEVPSAPENYILASQISQAEAKKYFIERIRAGRPYKSGVIWWNLLDGWPQMSDAVVDYYFTKKLAYHYIKRSQAPFAIVADEIKDWNMDFCACNDTLEQVRGHFRVLDGETNEVLLEKDFTAPVNSTTVIGRLPMFYSDKRFLILRWETDSGTGVNHYVCGYPPLDLNRYMQFMEKYGLNRADVNE